MTLTGHFSAQKWGYRQTKEGVTVTFLVDPSDITPEFAAAPLGTPLMIGYQEFDTETGQPKEAPKSQKEKGGFDTWPRSKQAGYLCKQPDFQKWLGVSKSSNNEEVEATSRVRLICEVESRSALDTDDSAASRWDEIIYRYREATGQTTERLW